MGKKFQAHLSQHLSTFLVGFTGVLGKIIYQNPILIVFFRTLFAAIGLFPFFLKHKKRIPLSFKSHLLFFCLGVIFVLHWFSFYKLSFSLSKSLLCVFIVIGVYFLVPQFSSVNNYFVGICWGVLSGFFMALAILWSRFLSSKFPTVVISFFQSFYCALLSLPFLFLLLPLQISLREWTMLLILGFFSTK